MVSPCRASDAGTQRPQIDGPDAYSPAAGYMLMDFEILPQFRKQVEGVVHVNGTSRIQVLRHREENPFMYDLLQYMDEKHDVPCMINTSFNGKGEPIVHTKEDALAAAERMGLDAVIINGALIL